MAATSERSVESLPDDLDRFLGNFFSSRGWCSELKYDPAADHLYLEVHLASAKLSRDDRFLSLVEYFGRAQDTRLRRRNGLPLRCRLYATDGSELTPTLHTRGSSYLDDDERGSRMRRRLTWLNLRRRLFARVLPGALAWAAALVVVVGVIGLSPDAAVALSVAALIAQGAITLSLARRRT